MTNLKISGDLRGAQAQMVLEKVSQLLLQHEDVLTAAITVEGPIDAPIFTIRFGDEQMHIFDVLIAQAKSMKMRVV